MTGPDAGAASRQLGTAGETTAPAGPPLRVLHLSDTHLFGDGTRHYGIVDTAAALRRVLRHAAPLRRLDAVVLSGDLSDDGSAQSYRTLSELVGPWAADRDAVVLYAMGNHDRREGFEAVLGDRTRSVTVRGTRLIVLDSAVPHRGHGHIGRAQRERLREALATAAPHGTVVVVHHPPTPARTPLLRALELDDADALLAVCAGTDVRAILSGHYHHALTAVESGIPVFVAPGVANAARVIADDGHERAVAGSGFALVEVPVTGAPSSAVVTVPGPADGTVLFDLDPAEVARVAAAFGGDAGS